MSRLSFCAVLAFAAALLIASPYADARKPRPDKNAEKKAAVEKLGKDFHKACGKYKGEAATMCDKVVDVCLAKSSSEGSMNNCAGKALGYTSSRGEFRPGYFDETLGKLAGACVGETDKAGCEKVRSKCLDAYYDNPAYPGDGDKCTEDFLMAWGPCASKDIIAACIATKVDTGRCGGSPDLGKSDELGKWLEEWKGLSCEPITAFEEKYDACLVSKNNSRSFNVSAEAIKAKMGDSGKDLTDFKDGCYVSFPRAVERCTECIDNYAERWATLIEHANDHVKNDIESAEKAIVNGDNALKKKDWAWASQNYEKAMKDVGFMRGAIAIAVAKNDGVPKPADLSGLSAAQANIEAKEKAYRDKWLAALDKTPCPKGKKRNGGLEKTLMKVYKAWLTDKTDGRHKAHQVRTNDPLYKETLIDGTKVETQDAWSCIEKTDVKEEPRCQYQRLSFERRKPRGSKWSGWGVSGLGEGGGLMCKNVKK